MDVEIQGLIIAAMRMAEHECGKFFMTQTWRLSMMNWPAASEMLRVHDPISAVVQYKLTHDAVAFETLPATDYVIIPKFMGCSFISVKEQLLPVIDNEFGDDRVHFDFVLGNDVLPEEVALYMKTQCAWWIRNPEAVQDGKFMPGPFIERMLHGAKIWWM